MLQLGSLPHVAGGLILVSVRKLVRLLGGHEELLAVLSNKRLLFLDLLESDLTMTLS